MVWGKKKALAVLESGDWDVLDVFLKTNPNHDEVARAGEMFLIKLYGRKHTCKTLEKLRYVLFMHKMSKVSSKFQLQNLPPTSDAARFHSYRAYYAVQEWLGEAQDVELTEWGWELLDGILNPVMSSKAGAPESVLLIISCGCKMARGKRCKCRKNGLYCTAMCSLCIGQTCSNMCESGGEDN